MRFWDTSAIVPLLVPEDRTDAVTGIFEEDPRMVVWWAAEVEASSALARLQREAILPTDRAEIAFERLDALVSSWNEIDPSSMVRTTARRLVRTHSLSAVDALQLAAAIAAAEGHPRSQSLVALDRHLVEASKREGLSVVEIPA